MACVCGHAEEEHDDEGLCEECAECAGYEEDDEEEDEDNEA